MWLPILVDVVAIAAGIAIVLMPADHGARNTAEDRACNCTGRGADARKDRTGESAGASADRRASRSASDRMIGSRSGSATAQPEARSGSG